MLYLVIWSFLLVLLVIIAVLIVWADLEDALLDLSLIAGTFVVLALLLPGFIERITIWCFVCWRDTRVLQNDVIVVVELIFAAYLIRGLIKLDPLGIVARRRRKN